MKVAHIVIVTPRRCGLYETTRELVCGLRKLGIDSRMVDIPSSNKLYPKGYPEKEDRGAPITDMKWAINSDVIVSHSGYDGTPLENLSQPVIHVAHGRPRSSFLSEKSGGAPVYSYHYKHSLDQRWKAVVTFWPEHIPYLQGMFPDKRIEFVPAPVDLEAWTPGDDLYGFGGNRGKINVVCTDAWRDDIDPFLPLHAFCLWARERDGAKLHLYAKPDNLRGYSALIRRIQDDGNMGEMLGWVKEGLDKVYRSADFLLTANTIDTRAAREAMACGCPVVRVDDTLNIGPSTHHPRIMAEQQFNPLSTAKAFKAVLES